MPVPYARRKKPTAKQRGQQLDNRLAANREQIARLRRIKALFPETVYDTAARLLYPDTPQSEHSRDERQCVQWFARVLLIQARVWNPRWTQPHEEAA